MPDPTHPSRRHALSLLAGSAAVLITGRARAAACTLTPAQTEGPYFVDERLERADIRSDPADGGLRPGVPLVLTLQIAATERSGCLPLVGAMVDIWHCDAEGVYSNVGDPNYTTFGSAFLRGWQATDAEGMARFTTIYPGWYPGRAVHIHFKVRAPNSAGKLVELTSQLYFDDAFTDRIHAHEPYAQRGLRRTKNARDGIYRNGGSALMLQATETEQGCAASFDIVMRMG